MRSIVDRINYKSVSATLWLTDQSINDWQIWTQDGPSDDTLLVSEKANVGIMFDGFFYDFFPLPLVRLQECGWHLVGDL